MVIAEAIILGAGMSGLVTAYELAKKGVNVRVLEKLSIPGGLARTIRFDGYYIDAGPHLFHTSNPEIITYWEELFPDVFRMPTLFGKNYIDGKFYEYPISEESLKILPPDQYELIQSELMNINPEKVKGAANYRDYMIALAGPTLQKIFYEDYPKKLWGMPTSRLSANWAPQRIEIRKEKKPFHAGQWTGVAKNGCGHTMEILAQKIIDLGGSIEYETNVLDLEHDSGIIKKIITNKGDLKIGSKKIIISTLPIHINSKFLNIRCNLGYRNVKLVNVVTKGLDPFPEDADWLYFKDPNIIFHRAGLQTRFSNIGIPNGWSIICCEIAYSAGDDISKMSDSILSERVIDDLKNLGFIKHSDILKIHTMDLGPVYPSYQVGYETELQRIRGELEGFSNFYFTGTLADFSYADFQILCAKAIDLVNLILDPGSAFNSVQRTTSRVKKLNPLITIGNSLIGIEHPPYIIGEIGLNHNGSVEMAKRLIDVCADSGCNAAKLQTFTANRISAKTMDARYNEDILDSEENLHQLFSRLIFSRSELSDIFDHAKSKNIDFFSTPFDHESLELLSSFNPPAYKIASMDIVNLPLISAVAKTMKPLIMSTGMSTLGNIEEAVATVLEAGNPNLILLHCVSSYPASAAETNLRMITRLKDSFNAVTGFSDHFPGIFLVPSSIALGARVIEKHVTLDKNLKGPDHIFSLEPDELALLVSQSLDSFHALGDGIKNISPGEQRTLQRLRRSIFAFRHIRKGETITKDMLIIKSPGIGMLPKYIDLIIGRKARIDINEDHPITWESI